MLVREEVSLVHRHPDTLPSPALLGLYKYSMEDGRWHQLHRAHTASARSPSLIVFPANQQKLGIPQYLINFASWYHVGTWGDHPLTDFPAQEFRDKKGSGLSPVAVASNAAAEHPPHQQRKTNLKVPGRSKWQALSLRVVGEAKGKSNTNKTSPHAP